MKTNELVNFKIEGTVDTTSADADIRVYFNKIPVDNTTLLISPTGSFEVSFNQLCDFKKNTISIVCGSQSYFHVRSIMFNNLKIDQFKDNLIDYTVSSSNNAYKFTFQSPYAYHMLDRL
jgi:hypothetical protein